MSQRTGWAERGAAAVEMALVLPVLVLILGGIVDYGRVFFTQIMLANAAREGARAAVVLASNPGCRAEVAAGATTCGGPTAISGWVPPTFLGGVGNAGTCVNSGTGTPPVEVTTSASFNYFFAGILPGVSSTTTLRSKAQMGCL